MAAGAALAAKRGKKSKSSLKGASSQMAKSMSESELRKMAKTKRKGKAHTQTEEKVGSPFAVLSRSERRPAEDAGQRKQSAIILGKGTKHEVSRENIATTRRIGTAIVHFACITSITCLRGSVLILFAPVNG